MSNKNNHTHNQESINNNMLDSKNGDSPTPYQLELLHVETQIEYDDIEMGVLESGIPYLSENGLARMCGIDRKTLREISFDWGAQRLKPRGKAIDQLLKMSGREVDTLFVKAEYHGHEVNAYTEPVCMAILEYYAFESSDPKPQALKAYRNLAKLGLAQLVYSATGYNPEQSIINSWKHFHDRVDLTLNAVEHGYFSIFNEIASMIVPMIRNGIMISDKVVPDISVGQAWGRFWLDNDMDSQYGVRKRYSHEYPLYYPQSKSNPQMAYCYPNEALGMFRNWFESTYITSKLPKYLSGQVKKGLDKDVYQKALESFKISTAINEK
ncbi:hypothetical protein B9T10_03765 [Wohlfahrtiimonas chitiniclastica]|uniref:hypothetical protein n=1 Tax=Wohlfahrtiimonas chitiniclastica TaxID=400946 RepID=UPI000B99BC59|nr:hypothetical protein [Wohlfahrtiimonas chitiniclastica]OYQ90449.1 hypothetical protein B9T10_03765 [Wohlfahrtiimonas chitiniclastica]